MFRADDRQHDRAARIGMSLFRISQAIKKITQLDSDEMGLSPLQIQALLFIHHTRYDMASMGNLAEVIAASHVTAVKLVNGLLEKGLVTKDKHPEDKRITLLRLTDPGLALVGRLDGWGDKLRQSLEGISEEAMHQLEVGLGGIIHRLHSSGYLVVSEPCRGCIHFRLNEEQEEGPHYCGMIHKYLTEEQSRKECPEHTKPL